MFKKTSFSFLSLIKFFYYQYKKLIPPLQKINSRSRAWRIGLGIFLGLIFTSGVSLASGGEGVAVTFLWIAAILVLAKLAGLVEKLGQPGVLGELVMGIILGNLAYLGFSFFEVIKNDSVIQFLAELGVIILLFQVGLESNIEEMRKVGWRSFLVAIIGVVTPFVSGSFIIGPWLMPGLSQNAYFFLGAALTATSVGITARVLRDLGKLKTKEAKMVLGAAVIDDILGLLILAVISAMVTVGSVSVGSISILILEAIAFLVGATALGHLLAPRLGIIFSKIHTGSGMKLALALSFALVFAYLAELIGLAPIVGAFAAGLILDPVHFRDFKDSEVISDIKKCMRGTDAETKEEVKGVINHHSRRQIEELIEPLGFFLIPIFFILTGMMVDVATLFRPDVILIAIVISLLAVFGKVIAGFAAGPGVNKWLIGWGMVPRGEVGLIFAAMGKSLGVVSDATFSVIIFMVIFTTLITPPVIYRLLK